jgi:hypothetical protein
MNEYNDYQFDDESTVASRTRSHTPPNHHQEKKQVNCFIYLLYLLEFSLENFSKWKKIK